MRRERLGELLQAAGLVAERDVGEALSLQARGGGLLGQALIRLGALSEADLLATLSEQLGTPIQAVEGAPAPEAA